MAKCFQLQVLIFTFRKDTLIKYGGIHRSAELGQLYGIVPFGVTGFDEEAIFYWRQHEGQLNKELFRRGYAGTKEFYSMLNDFNIRDKWSSFGEDVALYAVSQDVFPRSTKRPSIAQLFACLLLTLEEQEDHCRILSGN